MNNVNYNHSAFKIEKIRQKLAEDKKYVKLRKTYSRKYPEIDDLNTSDFWDIKNNEYSISKKTNPMAFNRIRLIRSLLTPAENKRRLNVGTGSGILERFVLGTSAGSRNWYGIDIAKDSIKKLKQRYPKAIFKIGRIQSLPFNSSFFDFVIVSEVLEHVRPSEIFRALGELKRVIKRDGRLIVTIPINEGLEEIVKNGLNPSAHVRDYSVELLGAELSIAGFLIRNLYTLYAFNNHYEIKTFICKLLPRLRQPNNLIVVAGK